MRYSTANKIIEDLGYDPNTVMRVELTARTITVVKAVYHQRSARYIEESDVIDYEEE